MIKATFTKESGKYTKFECNGHADYAPAGEDIVCAAVSVLTQNTVNSLIELAKCKIEYDIHEGHLSWIFKEECNKDGELLMNSLFMGLNNIQTTYNKLIIVKMKEV